MSVPLDVAPDPDRQRSPAEELDIEEVDEADRQIIKSFQAALNRTWWLARKKRLEKLLTRSFGQACTTASAGLLVTFICAGLLLYQQKAIQEPTLALAQASTAATVASEAAARWTAYTEWVFNVCPAEIERNMSTPACLTAMNETIPPPPRPEYREAHSIQHRLVRRLVPFINASHALETQILTSDNYCGAENVEDIFATIVECAQVAAPSHSERSVSGADQLSTMSGFRLPSIRDISFLNTLSAELPQALLESFFMICYQLVLVSAQAAIAYHSQIFEDRGDPWSVYLPWARTLCLFGYGTRVVQYTWTVSWAMAKDLYIQSCLSFQTSDIPIPDDCRLITDLTANLSLSDRIRAWSIWRGYFLALIDQYSTGDFLLLAVFSVLTMAYLPFMRTLCRRRLVVSSHRSQEEGLQERMKGR